MKSVITFLVLPLLIFVLFSNCQLNTQQDSTLRIATAANMQFVINDLVSEFQKETNIKSEIILGSSGKLTAQILAGAPYDLFISADMFYPNKIKEEGLGASNVYHYTNGNIVIWSMKYNALFDQLQNDNYKKIAIANPKTAPYGKAAQEFLQRFYNNSIIDKVIYGESISQVNQFVTSKTVDIGITSNFIVNASSIKNTGYYHPIPDSLYSPIQQGLIIIKDQNTTLAQQFVAFIKSAKGQKIIKSYLSTE